jgi:hypothetical protein
LSSSKLSWVRVENLAEWDSLVDRSPQGTLFSESAYLSVSGRQCDRFLVKQGIETKAGVCVVRSESRGVCELDDLVIYGGIMFVLDDKRQLVKRRHDEFQLTEFVIQQLDQVYSRIAIALSPQFHDMRPFLWHHYHDVDPALKYRLDLRYTSYVNISSLRNCGDKSEETECFSAMETVRRYSVREARKKGGAVRVGTDGSRLVEFYRTMMAQQGEHQPDIKLDRMRIIVDKLAADGRGAVYEVLNRDGQVIYVTVYGWDKKRAYYLFGAGHAEISEPWQGTLVHWEAFKDLATRVGIAEVDMEGVNSPQRGWFKLGFGGDMRPYYQVYKGATA